MPMFEGFPLGQPGRPLFNGFPLPIPDASALPAKKPLENTSWADIAIIAAAGMAPFYWAVGDTKTIALGTTILGSTSITVEILGFSYDDLAAGGKAPISFGMVDCFATVQSMNSTNTNVGGWGSSAIRATLINTVLPALQTVIGANIIKAVTKRTSAGNNSSTIVTSTDSVWMMSEYEIHGSLTYSYTGENPTDKNIRYPAFAAAADRIKKVGASAYRWLARSPRTGSTQEWASTDTSGGKYADSGTAFLGIAIGFCV